MTAAAWVVIPISHKLEIPGIVSTTCCSAGRKGASLFLSVLFDAAPMGDRQLIAG
jgi:hypothetical protein